MTHVYQAFMGIMATVFDNLQEAHQSLAQLPPSQERTVLLKCVGVLQQGVNNTCVYFQAVVPEPGANSPDITDEDTRPFVPIRDE